MNNELTRCRFKDEEENTLYVLPGGILLKVEWYYDEEKEEGYFIEKDMTNISYTQLFEKCRFKPDVTLKDILSIVSEQQDIYQTIIPYCHYSFIEEAFKDEKPYTGEYGKDEIEYLQISKKYDEPLDDDDRGEFYTDITGIGFELKENYEDFYWQKGQRISWGIDFVPVNELVNLPIKINNEIIHQYYDEKNRKVKTKDILKVDLTWGEIVYGIFYELSFYGDPENRDEIKKSLSKINESCAIENDSDLIKEIEQTLK